RDTVRPLNVATPLTNEAVVGPPLSPPPNGTRSKEIRAIPDVLVIVVPNVLIAVAFTVNGEPAATKPLLVMSAGRSAVAISATVCESGVLVLLFRKLPSPL